MSTASNTASFAPLFDHQQFAQYPSEFTTETLTILRTILSYLLELLIEIGHDQSELHLNDNQQRLVQYLSVLIHFTRYTPEKLLLAEHDYLHALCSLISHTKLMEDHTSTNGGKLLIFIFLQQLTHEKLVLANILNCEDDFKQQLPMCLIIVDHEDQELILYNRLFLFLYYNILKQLCQYSGIYARHLAMHKNMIWALKNVLSHTQLYPDACDQLLSIYKVICHAEHDVNDDTDVQTIQELKKDLFFHIHRSADTRSSSTIMLHLTRDIFSLHATHDERLQTLHRRGLPTLTNLFFTVHSLYHDQTQTHNVQDDLMYLIGLISNLLDTAALHLQKQQITMSTAASSPVAATTTIAVPATASAATSPLTTMRNIVGNQWKEKSDLVYKLLFLLNSYNSSEIRQRAIDLLTKIIVQLTIQDLASVASHAKSIHEQAAAQSHAQLGPCKI
jgi:ubiquitin carboxyl-terminal hydrolase 34